MKDGDDLKYYHMDVIWGHLVKQKTIFGKLEFDLLSKVAKLVLEKRGFSVWSKKQDRGLCKSAFQRPWFHIDYRNVQQGQHSFQNQSRCLESSQKCHLGL